jgi:hypothetical protein
MTAEQPQAFRGLPFVSVSIPQAWSRYHRDARGFHNRRALLSVGEAVRFVFIGVHAAKFFAVGVKNSHQKMVMFAALIFAKISFLFLWGFSRRSFGH